MDYHLEVPKEKQAFLEELLRGFPFIKAKKLSVEKAERMRDMLEAVEEITAIEAGKRNLRLMKALLADQLNGLEASSVGSSHRRSTALHLGSDRRCGSARGER